MAAFQIRKIQSIIVLIIVLIAILWLFKDNISKVSVFQKHTQQFDTIKEELKDITYLEKIDNFLIKEYSKEQLLLHTIEADTYYRYKNSPVKLLNIKLTQYDEIGQKKAVLTSNRAEIRKSGDIFFKDKINIQSKNGALHEINTESLIVLSNSGQIISNSEVAYLGENAIIHAQGMEMSNNDDTMSLVGDVIINQDSGAVIETVNLFVSHDDGEKIYKSTGKTFYNSNVESVEILTKSDLETLSDSELILKAIDSGIRDKIEFAGSQALDHDIPSYEKDLANREELIESLVELTKRKPDNKISADEGMILDMNENLMQLLGRVEVLNSSGSTMNSYNLIVDQSNGGEVYKSNHPTHYQTKVSDIRAKRVHYDAKTKNVELTGGVQGVYE